ncbi:MAG: hypothetical protein ACYTET_05735 [Planctomycetota bacterium]|jgi:hypothetical protein
MRKPKREFIIGVVLFAGIIVCVTGFTKQQDASEKKTSSPWPVTTIPVQLSRDVYGIAMIDSRAETMWVYEFSMRGNSFDRLRLVAARSFEFDRQLTEWNTGSPTPRQVEEILNTLEKKAHEKAAQQEAEIQELQEALDQ